MAEGVTVVKRIGTFEFLFFYFTLSGRLSSLAALEGLKVEQCHQKYPENLKVAICASDPRRAPCEVMLNQH